MITDVLTDTCDAIEEYLVDHPETYAHCIDEVRAVYNAIVALRRKLDDPQSDDLWQTSDLEEDDLCS